jgi:TetR/AcrR family transcriptional repressor of nem operon
MGRNSDAKERLLQVAFELIWGQSYGSVSVDQICQKAEVKKGSFYYYFPSKSDLAAAAYEQYWQSCQPRYDQIFSPQIPPLQRIEGYCRMLYEGQRTKQLETGQVLGCPFTSVGSELSTQDEKIRQKSEQMMERICRYLESALRDACQGGWIPEQDFKAGAESICSHIMGKLLQAKIKNDAEVLQELHPAVMALVGAREATV